MDTQTHEIFIHYERQDGKVIIHRPGFQTVVTREKCEAVIRLIHSRRTDYLSEESYLRNLKVFEDALKLFEE
jgi:hypothetical protein